ncbi:hypothetical protein SO802_027195 [Lithocarpus litseifolius]|uniref:DDE Tnp4 domain-containing protein n=1 Tax=Lithocarpus litseifolius TaxID=425828 RepID=A0AAW2C1Q4_9ROSI
MSEMNEQELETVRLQGNNDGSSPSNSNAGNSVHESCFPFLMADGENLWENYALKLNKGNHNKETISRQFRSVLKAILKIGKKYIKHDHAILHEGDDRWKWFKGALGALDGTHVPLTVPIEDQGRYRNRKGGLSTSVLGACDANLKFIYVLPGWEGFASDSLVLCDALSRPYCQEIPSNTETRNHLHLWRGNTPTDYKELFNLRHLSARNTIERAFELLEKRWAILRTTSFYEMKTQIRVINACCILHNFIRDEMNEDKLLRAVDLELEDVSLNENEISKENIIFGRVTDEWTAFQDALAKEMFEEYQSRHRRVI